MDGELLALPKRYITKWLSVSRSRLEGFFPPRSLGLLSALPPASPGGEMGGGEAECRWRSGPVCSSHLILGIPKNSIQSSFPKRVFLGSEQ